MVLPEAEWQSSATRLGLQLMSAGARGVYQAQLPLQLVASLDLGCVASVAPSARQRTLGDGFALSELQVGTWAMRMSCSVDLTASLGLLMCGMCGTSTGVMAEVEQSSAC